MKKLRNKVFVTLFIIFSSFILITLMAYNISNYQKEYQNINNSLIRMTNFIDDNSSKMDNMDVPPKNSNPIVMGYDAYTVLLDSNNNIKEIISNSSEDLNFNIENIAKEILNNNNKNNKVINNLYFKGYSYYLKYNDMLIVINTNNITERLSNLLIVSIILLILLEIGIIFISYIITNWLIKPAEESFNKQKDFIADASHELKTPLAIIMASSDALETDKKNNKYINNIKNETEKMNKLITSLLDLSKLESGVNKTTYQKENLSKIVEKSILTFESYAFENNTKIKSNVTKDIYLNCSNVEMSELLSILIDNAIKHSNKNTSINVNLYIKKNNIILEVINIGDPIKEPDKIFERFYREDKSRNRNSNRYGLGLAIAKNIVINHNGKISAYSKDKKTTFKVIF